MPRIRSIHPGLFTDELYMSLSMPAKAVWPGLWTEADDQGVFEWKPLTLKARLMPAENVDMAAILTEYVEKGLASNFDHDGKHYGVIKGFGNWQRPKKPAYRFPIPDQLKTFAAWKPLKGEAVPNQFPTPTPKCPQRKEEGGRREEEGGNSVAKATGGKPPTSREIIFREYLPWIMEKLEKDREHCATQMGVLVKEAGGDYDIALTALTAARETDAANPFTYAKSCLKPRESYEQRRIREGLEVINAYEADHDRH